MTATTTTTHLDTNRRHDFVLLFDVQDGNPNGDPDAGNTPRVDPESMQGLVTDVSLKRKVRDWIDVGRGTEARFKIYVQRESYLTDTRGRVFDAHAEEDDKPTPATARQWMCQEFYDIRTFGAVMGMRENNAGQVRGPIQLTFARSIDPITQLDMSIARVALERGERPGGAESTDEVTAPTHGTFGRKTIVPYGLYRAHGFFVPSFAEQNGFDSDDLALFWTALQMMWDLDRSASRGLTGCRGLYIFSHDSKLGNAPAHKLFERITIPGVGVPRAFSDYAVAIDEADMPEGVTLTRLGE